MGPRLRPDLPGYQLFRHRGLSLYAGYRRGTLLSWRAFLPVEMVFQKGAELENVHLLRRFSCEWRLWKPDCCGYLERPRGKAWDLCMVSEVNFFSINPNPNPNPNTYS